MTGLPIPDVSQPATIFIAKYVQMATGGQYYSDIVFVALGTRNATDILTLLRLASVEINPLLSIYISIYVGDPVCTTSQISICRIFGFFYIIFFTFVIYSRGTPIDLKEVPVITKFFDLDRRVL